MSSTNSFKALVLTIYNMTDVKNKDGCKLCSCLHADGDSEAGLPPPEHGDDATVGHCPWHPHPKVKQASPWECHHQPRTARQHSTTEMNPYKLFSGMIRVKKKPNPNHTKKPAGMPEEED